MSVIEKDTYDIKWGEQEYYKCVIDEDTGRLVWVSVEEEWNEF